MDVVLTAGERQELVTVLRELDPTAPKERRGSVRRKTLLNLWMQRIGENEAGTISKVVLVNVSVSGVGILTKMPFLRGEKFAIPLPFAEGGGWLVLCEVRNCQRLMSGHYKVGGGLLIALRMITGMRKYREIGLKNSTCRRGETRYLGKKKPAFRS